MFTHLHLHTAKGSLLDSILTVEQAVKFAKDNGHKAIAITDHGSMAGFVDFVKECKKNDIKPIIGNEIYEVDDMNEKADTKEYYQPRYHLILLAKTQEGFKNLIKITSVSRTDGFYKKPRIDLNYIKENNLGNGIICSTACQAGRLSRYLVAGKEVEAYEYIRKLQDTFDYVVCELQSHATQDQMYANNLIHFFAMKNNIPYIFTTDAHMLSNKLIDSHAMFVEIGESREVGESYTDCYLQTEDEIYEKMSCGFSRSIIKEGLDETNHIADMVEDIDIGLNKGNIMPKVNIDNGFEDHKEYLRYLVFNTFEEKFGHMSKEEQDIRRQRLEMELPVLYAVDYTDYFIMLYMLAKEARKRNIPLGYSRGSGANCLCLFMLNVTQIDSVRWDLDFSRFANLGRKSMADFDWDISKRRRKEMVEISEELFGKENVAPIATFNTLSTKVAIRDIGKVLNEKKDSPYYMQIPYTMRDEVAKMIPTIKTLNDLGEEEEKDVLLKDILSKNDKLNEIYNKFPLWFKYVMDVEGLPKSMGRHAAGTLITPTPITDYCPLCYDSEKNIMIELEMHNAMDDLGLIKMDYLGLETLDIIDDALKMAGITWEDVDINHLNLNDKEVFDSVYKKGNTVGIFQMESAEARKMCIEAQADNVEDIIVVNAANRPGTKESFPDYCKNKLHPDDVEVLHEDLRTMFGKTQYVLLYQEQALQLFRYAGFPEEQVDNARRCIDEHSLITMGDGSIKEIKDINVGDLVSCVNEENGHITYSEVENVFDNGYQDTFCISTVGNNDICCTGTHKFLTQDGWKMASELTENDYVMTPIRLNPSKDNIKSNRKPSTEQMYLLGLLIGDGCIVNRNNIHFTNSEIELIEEFKKCVCTFGEKFKKNRTCEFSITSQDGVTVDNVYTVCVKTMEYKQKLMEFCDKYELTHKRAAEKKIPDEIMSYTVTQSSRCKTTWLLIGLFNTDGGYNIASQSIEYYTTSKILALQIKNLLLKYNIQSYLSVKRVNEYDYDSYTLMIRSKEAQRLFIKYIGNYIVGKKKDDYLSIYNISSNRELNMNYILPEKYNNEIYQAYVNSEYSFSELGKMFGYENDGTFKISNNTTTYDTKARMLCSVLYCPESYKLLCSDYMPIKVKSITKDTTKHVYDIQVKGHHNYIANNIIVHNCIGKKKKDEMARLEVDFTKGLVEKKWNENQTETIWQLMLKQAEYCFNRGHAVAYGLLSYLTAYLKTHYTIYFMASLLTSKSDKVEKISIVINDCKRLGIKVSPPNVNISNKEFTALPDKNEILFGLLAVKGLGDSIVSQIISKRPYTSFNDFVGKVNDKTAIITLIKAGAIPTKDKMMSLRKYASSLFDKREYKPVTSVPSPYSKLLQFGLNVDNYRDGKKVDKERLLNDYNDVKRKMFEDDMQNKYKAHMEEFRDNYAKDEYMWEFDTLSMFLTNDPLEDAYKYTKASWNEINDNEKITLFCVIVDIKRKKDKNGNQFAYLDLYTPFGIIEATIWSSQLKQYAEYIKKGSCLAILGRKREGNHFFVEKVKTYNTWKTQMIERGELH